jgi:hypothetical protein
MNTPVERIKKVLQVGNGFEKLFTTPKDWKQLENWIELHPPEDRAQLYIAAFMAWNLATKLVNGFLNEEEA